MQVEYKALKELILNWTQPVAHLPGAESFAMSPWHHEISNYEQLQPEK